MEPLVINNKYRIEKKLGEGGMGAVYEAEHIELGTKLALKQLKEKFSGQRDIMRRFKQEGRDMFNLKHPHIVRVFDYGLEEGFGAYLVMDLVEGEDLAQMIKNRGPLAVEEITRIGGEVASALDYAHRERGLVHRDIKPGNIMIERTTGRAIVTDFGIAKHTQDEETSVVETDTGVFVGTKRYSSPEQMRAQAEELDGRSDIYSLGAVVYEMCSGRRFLEGMPENLIMIRVGGFADWKPDLAYPPSVPQSLIELIDACLERDRDKRIKKASEVIERLKHIRDEGTKPIFVQPPPGPAPARDETERTTVNRFEPIRLQLRQNAEAALQRIAELEPLAVTLNTEIGGEQIPAIRTRLAAVTGLEEAGSYENAVQELQRISALADEQERNLQDRLRNAIEDARRDLADSWQALAARAAGFLSDPHVNHFQQVMAYVVEKTRSGDFERAASSLTEARQAQADAEANARQHAERVAEELIAAIRRHADELANNGGLPADFDRQALEASIATALDAGRYAQVRTDAAAAQQVLETALAELRRRQADRARSAQEALRTFLRNQDVDKLRAAAAALVQRAQNQERAAQRALQQDDHEAAANGYEAALADYREANQRARQNTFEAQVQAQRDVLDRIDHLRSDALGSGMQSAGAAPDLDPLRRSLQELEDNGAGLAAGEAQERLAALSERAEEARTLAENDLIGAIRSALDGVAERWRAFADNAGQFVSAGERQSLDRSIAAARQQLGTQALEVSIRSSATLREQVAQAERRANTAARQEVDVLLRRAGEVKDEIVALDPAEPSPSVDLEQLRHDIEGELEKGHLAAVDELAASTLERLVAIRTELQRMDAEQAVAARAAMAAIVEGIDLESAARVARDSFEAASAAQRRADAALADAEHRAAAAAYDEARQNYEVAGRQVTVAVETATEALRRAVARIRNEPVALVGEALRGGEAALADDSSLLSLERAIAAIDDASAQAGVYTAAVEAQQRCRFAERRVVERPQAELSRRLQRRVRTATASREEAERDFGQQQWAAAAERFAAAADAWVGLDQEIEQRKAKTPIPWSRIGAGGGITAAAAILAWLIGPAIVSWLTTESPPSQPPQVPFAIAQLQPSNADMSLKEGETQKFAVELRGGAPGATADMRWSLDGELLGEKSKQWSYTPDYKAARGEPHLVRAQVGEGGDAPKHEWKVRVDDVNRAPVAKAQPPAGMVVAEVGKAVTFRADVTDEDEDRLQYAWKVDGEPVGGNTPALELKVGGNHRIGVAVSDGKVSEPVALSWEIASIAQPDLLIAYEPQSLPSLRYRTPQEFKLLPPPDVKGLKYEWSLNGGEVRGSSRYVFANDDASLARKPVQVVVTATDEAKRKFTHGWTFKIVPPPKPQIVDSAPASPIEVAANSAVTLKVDAGTAASGQEVSYVFSVDGGAERPSNNPELRFTPQRNEHTVIARAVDNFGQKSDPITWKVRRSEVQVASVPREPPAVPVPADATAAVKAWLDEYRNAFVSKNVVALQSMMKLSSDKTETLKKQLALQNNLEVAFSNIKVEPLGDGRFRATYSRSDSFTNAQTGTSFSPPAVQVQQEFQNVGGRIQLVK